MSRALSTHTDGPGSLFPVWCKWWPSHSIKEKPRISFWSSSSFFQSYRHQDIIYPSKTIWSIFRYDETFTSGFQQTALSMQVKRAEEKDPLETLYIDFSLLNFFPPVIYELKWSKSVWPCIYSLWLAVCRRHKKTLCVYINTQMNWRWAKTKRERDRRPLTNQVINLLPKSQLLFIHHRGSHLKTFFFSISFYDEFHLETISEEKSVRVTCCEYIFIYSTSI